MEGFEIAVEWANWPPAMTMFSIIFALIVFAVGHWFAVIASKAASRFLKLIRVDVMVARFLRALIYAGLMVAVVIAALNEAGIHTTSVAALLASFGVAIGLALKDSLANLASGVMILVSKPYRLQDSIDAAGTTGTVDEVSIVHTILRTDNNVKIIVPNSSIMAGSITNYSAYDRRRVEIILPIGHNISAELARSTLMDVMQTHPLVLQDPAPEVIVHSMTRLNLDLAMRAWTQTGDHDRVQSEILERIKLRFEEMGVDLT